MVIQSSKNCTVYLIALSVIVLLAGVLFAHAFGIDYKGASLGMDYCTNPKNLTNGYKKSHALLLTSGFSFSPSNSKTPTFSYDYYWQIS